MQQGDVRIAFGIMGGWNQAQAHAQFVSNIVDFGMNIQAAHGSAALHQDTFNGCDVRIENRIPANVRNELDRARATRSSCAATYSDVMGGGQAVMRDFATGVNFGASDPRKDGEAIPQPMR